MIDFSDTPIGDELEERISVLQLRLEGLEDQVRETQEEIDKLQLEYDMLEEMYEDSLEELN